MLKNNEIRHIADRILKDEWGSVVSKSVLMFLLLIVIQSMFSGFLVITTGSMISGFDSLFIQTLSVIIFLLLRGLPRLFIGMGFKWNFLNLANKEPFNIKTFFAPITEHPVRNVLVVLVKGIIVSLPVIIGTIIFGLVGGPTLLISGNVEIGAGIVLIFAILMAAAIIVSSIWLNAIMAFTDFVLKDKMNLGTFEVIRSAFNMIKGHVLKYIGLELVLVLQLVAGNLIVFGMTALLGGILGNINQWLPNLVLFIGSVLMVVFTIGMMIRFYIIDAVFYKTAAESRITE